MDPVDRVLECLGTTESATLAAQKAKSEIASHLWETPKVILKGEVLAIRDVGGSLHIARKTPHHDEWDAPIPVYNPYGPGQPITDDLRRILTLVERMELSPLEA